MIRWNTRAALAAAPTPEPSANRDLSNLLALIHGDGGHYEAAHGTDEAVRDALVEVLGRTGFDDEPSDAGMRDGWRDIASAPKDGTWILAWLGGVANVADTIQWAFGGWWNGDSGFVSSSATPAHWRPLPPPPTKEPRA